MSKNKNKRQGDQVVPTYALGNYTAKTVKELCEAIEQRNQQYADTQSLMEANMRTLLAHLEEGEVFYKAEMAIPSSLINRQPTTLIILRTLLRSDECTWVVRHEPTETHFWKANYICKRNVFSAFQICSGDRVTIAR